MSSSSTVQWRSARACLNKRGSASPHLATCDPTGPASKVASGKSRQVSAPLFPSGKWPELSPRVPGSTGAHVVHVPSSVLMHLPLPPMPLLCFPSVCLLPCWTPCLCLSVLLASSPPSSFPQNSPASLPQAPTFPPEL